MNRIILSIEIGDWDGGNNGQYPKLIEYVSSDEKSPFYESDGWGHGLGGGCSSIQSFVSSSGFRKLDSGGSKWAYVIIEKLVAAGCTPQKLGGALSEAYIANKPKIPENLMVYLNNA